MTDNYKSASYPPVNAAVLFACNLLCKSCNCSYIMSRPRCTRTLLFILSSIIFLIIIIRYQEIPKHWNTKNVAGNLRKWFKRAKTVQQKGRIQVRMFDPPTELYGSVPRSALTIEYDEDDDESYVGGFTVGRFDSNIPQPHGLMWQWRGGEIYHGFLYGKVDSLGRFTGDNITFIYPDLETGLQGKFVNGELVDASAVKIVAERWINDLKELSFVKAEPP